MRLKDLPGMIGKTSIVNGRGDLAFDGELKEIIGKECKVIKQCKSGLIQVEHENKLYQVPLRNINSLLIECTIRRNIDLSKWTFESIQDLKTYHGVNLETEISKLIEKEITNE